MNRISLLLILIGICNFSYATSIPIFTFNELIENSKFIIIGEVTSVVKFSEQHDKATITVKSQVKGFIPTDKAVISVLFSVRGVKDFDTIPKIGDQGVYFLREGPDNFYYLARYGAVALFEENRYE